MKGFRTYRVIIKLDENGSYYASVPALPGCFTWGDSVEEVRLLIKDAMDVYLRSLIKDGELIPNDDGIEVMESVQSPEYV
jgi:antitoxin HicB